MKLHEAVRHANDFLKDNYNLSLKIPIKRNNRLQKAMGRFVWYRNGNPAEIQLAGFLLDYSPDHVIVKTLEHELVHYALFVKDEPFKDGHPHFESELELLGLPSSGTRSVVKPIQIYTCDTCGAVHATNRKIAYNRFFECKLCSRAMRHAGRYVINRLELGEINKLAKQGQHKESIELRDTLLTADKLHKA